MTEKMDHRCPDCGVYTSARSHLPHCKSAASSEAKLYYSEQVGFPPASTDADAGSFEEAKRRFEYNRYCAYRSVRDGHWDNVVPLADFDLESWLKSPAYYDVQAAGGPIVAGLQAGMSTKPGSVNSSFPAAGLAENPKEATGAAKVQMHMVPAGALVEAAAVFQYGAAKYGSFNWRVAGIKVNTYIGGVLRHLLAVMDGQDMDDGPGGSGLSHWAHIAAGALIVLDAQSLGKLTDDRVAPGRAAELLAQRQS